jgi:hypothetical protein
VPIGGIVIVVLFFFLKVPVVNTPVMAGLKAIDWTGNLLIVGSALMVLLGLEFGDITYPWSSAAVLSLIVIGSAVFGLFILNEWKVAVNPVIPLRLFSNKSSVAGLLYTPVVSSFSSEFPITCRSTLSRSWGLALSVLVYISSPSLFRVPFLLPSPGP